MYILFVCRCPSHFLSPVGQVEAPSSSPHIQSMVSEAYRHDLCNKNKLKTLFFFLLLCYYVEIMHRMLQFRDIVPKKPEHRGYYSTLLKMTPNKKMSSLFFCCTFQLMMIMERFEWILRNFSHDRCMAFYCFKLILSISVRIDIDDEIYNDHEGLICAKWAPLIADNWLLVGVHVSY